MFTIEQIKAAHSKVKSGADFPKYVQDIIKLGVTGYETFVADGHTIFYGRDGYKIQSPAKYVPLSISEKSDKRQFHKELKEHQQGNTNFPTFCGLSAKRGVEKWVVDMNKMTCVYNDKAGTIMLKEHIPVS